MLSKLLNYIRSEEDQDPSFIRVTRNILIIVMVINLAVIPLITVFSGIENVWFMIGTLSVMFVLNIIALLYVQRGKVLFAKLIVPIGLIITVFSIAYTSNGLQDTAIVATPVILVISAILLGRRSLILITPLAVLAAIITAALDFSLGRDPSPIQLDDAIIVPLLLVGSAGITHLLITRLNESTLRAQKSELIQKNENAELLALRASLEERVQERTSELEKANQSAERRARQFRAVTQVVSAVSSVQSLDELLPLITRVISEQFNVYHTGVFLLDENQEFAVLRAANSTGGQKMLARNHKLAVGQAGIVGYVTATGQPRIALDVEADSAFFDNPDLPETRSEIALPLQYAGQIIGALDVQSVEANAFQPDDISVLSTLANQVAVAINNAFTIEEAKKTLLEAQSAIGQIGQEAWQVLRPKQLGLGFYYSESGVKPLQKPIENPEASEALGKGEAVLTSGQEISRLAVPIHLRGQVVGVMQLSTRGEYKLTEDDADIAKAVAERLSLAIETATLLQSTQHRAEIEKITANISSRIGSSAQFDTILQTAAQELSRALGGSDVLVQIEPAALKMYT